MGDLIIVSPSEVVDFLNRKIICNPAKDIYLKFGISFGFGSKDIGVKNNHYFLLWGCRYLYSFPMFWLRLLPSSSFYVCGSFKSKNSSKVVSGCFGLKNGKVFADSSFFEVIGDIYAFFIFAEPPFRGTVCGVSASVVSNYGDRYSSDNFNFYFSKPFLVSISNFFACGYSSGIKDKVKRLKSLLGG